MPDGAYPPTSPNLDILKKDLSYAASVVISMTYGKTTPTTYSDPEVKGIIRVTRHFNDTLRPGAYLVDTYPFLKHIPGYLRHLYKYHEEELVLFHELIADTKRKIVRGGSPRECL